MQPQPQPAAKSINRPVYVLFVLAGLFFIFLKDLSNAVIFGALALAFDPFDEKIPFSKRPIYQRAWLLVHLTVILGLLVWEIAWNNPGGL